MRLILFHNAPKWKMPLMGPRSGCLTPSLGLAGPLRGAGVLFCCGCKGPPPGLRSGTMKPAGASSVYAQAQSCEKLGGAFACESKVGKPPRSLQAVATK